MTLSSRGNRKLSPGLLTQSRAERFRYVDRMDFFHEIDWRDAINTDWQCISLVEHALSFNNQGILVHEDRSIPSPVKQGGQVYTANAIMTMAVLVNWHQVTTMQLACILNTTMRSVWRSVSSLYEAGIVLRADPPWSKRETDLEHHGTGSIWSIDKSSELFSDWLNGLDDLEYSLLTGGLDHTRQTSGGMAGPAMRHNLVTAELALRAIEMCPGIAGSWGEAYATAESIHGKNDYGKYIADGVLIAKNGSLIVMEISGANQMDNGHAGQRIANKTAVWSSIAARSQLDIKILFINVGMQLRIERLHWWVLKGIEQTSRYLVRTRDRDKAASSVFVSNAYDWFPLPRVISSSFESLESWSPLDEKYHAVVPVDLELDREVPSIWNVRAGLQTPSWITSHPESIYGEARR